MRVLGIDPGTKTMDLCLLDNGEVVGEASIETSKVASNPETVLEEISKLKPFDVIVVPSGYGVEPLDLERIPRELLEEWYYTFVLATTREEILESFEKGIIGAKIYFAMVRLVERLYELEAKKILIPGVINLPTVPLHRKINKIDMGTADKLAVAVLGIHEVASTLGVDYEHVNYIHVELGFGYNAVMGVEKGLIVDGVGGSFTPGPGFLTAGALDLEVAQSIGKLDKKDVFTTGCGPLTGVPTPEDMVGKSGSDWRSKICLEAFIEGVVKSVHQIMHSVKNPDLILLSGRVSRIPGIRLELEKRLGGISEVKVMKGLPGARSVKETAQGYSLVGDGLTGGVFKDLITHVKVDGAVGSALDYVLIPAFFESRLGRNFLRLRGVGFRTQPLNTSWWSF
jgi:predicted butyrate kinase (DUF1464 family)